MLGVSLFKKSKQVSTGNAKRKMKISFKIDWFYVVLFALFVGACFTVYICRRLLHSLSITKPKP